MKYAIVRYDPVRVVVATAGLAVAGAAAGGLAAALALFTVTVMVEVPYGLFALPFAVAVGAVLGLISAPVVIWGLLRRVPLGSAFFWLTASTVLGGVFGWLAFSWVDLILAPTFAAFVAFMACAIALSFRYERAPALTRDRAFTTPNSRTKSLWTTDDDES